MALVIRRWKERCASGVCSESVLGLGTIRVMGKAGDAPVQFPRIPSLDAPGTLEPDEHWAVQAAQSIVTQACNQHRHNLVHSPRSNPLRCLIQALRSSW